MHCSLFLFNTKGPILPCYRERHSPLRSRGPGTHKPQVNANQCASFPGGCNLSNKPWPGYSSLRDKCSWPCLMHSLTVLSQATLAHTHTAQHWLFSHPTCHSGTCTTFSVTCPGSPLTEELFFLALAGFERIDSNFERSSTTDKVLSHSIACYREIVHEKEGSIDVANFIVVLF